LRATVPKVTSTYTNHGKERSTKRKSVKISIDRKRSSYTEKDCFEKSQGYCSTGDRTEQLNMYVEDPVSTETV
jgi:hypothetical protein